MFYKLNEQGDPVPTTPEELRESGADPLTMAIGQTRGERYQVSTVFLRLDHSHGAGPPLLYETMVFDGSESAIDVDCVRYSTRQEAETGHVQMVLKWEPTALHKTKWGRFSKHMEPAELEDGPVNLDDIDRSI